MYFILLKYTYTFSNDKNVFVGNPLHLNLNLSGNKNENTTNFPMKIDLNCRYWLACVILSDYFFFTIESLYLRLDFDFF